MLALSAAAPAAAGLSTLAASPGLATSGSTVPAKIHFRTQKVGDVEVFYREAGPADAPVLLLLHGFPSSGHMYRDLIPHLADSYRVIAPDLPGFGETAAPPREEFTYGFATLATTMEGFVDALGLERYAIYIFDYGAPVGLRLALAQQDRISAIVSQNGNAYVEGLSQGWSPIQRYWREPTKENREALRIFQTPDAVRQQYVMGVPDPSLVSTDGSNLDSFFLARAGRDEIQLDLILDYRSNVELYPQFHAYFRTRQPPLLAVWGRNDPFFLPAGADAFKRDIPGAEVHFFDTGHFALETHHQEIAALLRDFLGRQKL
ncbi:alpha/beta fold hydrolase [Caenispirillum bisanense]|uniref:Pimeloyl-ACP methyl ester carboxylesterase n=1 Tax=Caenispirillum bisanense TaxID=414052 RepID=A0A286G800_9PROT|nr:alpha/beta hydrolase [Caenispirillum bisanense]SOD91645.1 Pimeloyl-ACP methyl ester carboxylesterase [Caenispirillum bisanense]